MTREEKIMQMDEGELYTRLLYFLNPGYQSKHLVFDSGLDSALGLCYQAEEKIKGMGEEKWVLFGSWLTNILVYENNISSLARDWKSNIAHTHPKQRAQAILMTIGESHE